MLNVKPYIAALSISLIFFGCAGFQEKIQRMTNRGGLTQDELIALPDAEKEREKADRARRQFMRSLRPGLNISDVESNVGAAYRADLVDGKFLKYYDDEIEPMILTFDDKSKLIGWRIDDTLVRQRLDQREAERNRESNAINSMPRPRNCTSTVGLGGVVQTNCY